MAEANLDQFKAAVATLSEGDMTKDGAPKMKALNAALSAAGLDDMDTNQRDAYLAALAEAEVPEEGAGAPDTPEEGEEGAVAAPDEAEAPKGQMHVITEAAMNPVPVRRNGVLLGEYRVGHPYEMSDDVLEILNNSGHTVAKA